MSQSHELTVADGTKVEIEHVKPLSNGGARFDIEADDGRKWRLDVTKSGNPDIVTSWEDGTLAELEMPDWMDHVLSRLQVTA